MRNLRKDLRGRAKKAKRHHEASCFLDGQPSQGHTSGNLFHKPAIRPTCDDIATLLRYPRALCLATK